MSQRFYKGTYKMPNVMTTQEEGCSLWQFIPDSVLLHVFSYLPTRILLNASQVCKVWHRVAMDEYLWKDLLYRMWHIDTHIPMAPGKLSWLQEFRRLYYHTPQIESEVLRDHRDQVLHISFSHNGQMFATSSKDGYVKVWTASYPSRVKYYADMREFTWKYTQFSQFNETDTLLLVSGVHFGAHSTSGEIAVFNLVDGFELQCRVLNKPYDIFGTWYNETYLLSGNLHWLGHLTSCSVLWLNKASQALEAENESVVMRLYKFRNINASSIRTVMIAKCHDDDTPMKTAVVNAPPAQSAPLEGDPQPSTSSGPVSQQRFGILPQTSPPCSPPPCPLELPNPSAVVAAAAAAAAAAVAVPVQCQEDMSMKGADTSQSECSQGKSKRKESRIKMWQKVQVLTDGDRGVRLLEVDDSNDDGEETIEYNMDYRRAESHLMEVCGGCGDPESEERLGPLAGLLPFGDVDMLDDSQDGEDSQAFFSSRTKAPPNGDQQLGALGGGGQFGVASHSEYRSGQPSRTADCRRKGSSSKSRQMSPAAATGTSRGCRNTVAAATNDSPPVGVAKCFSNPRGDINVNTDSTGNNNSNPFSLHPLFAPSPPSASPPCAPVPSASGDGPHQPIGATCSAAAPQPLPSTLAGCRMSELDFTGTGDRYLIFTTGMKTYTPHQIGIKRIRSLEEACPADVKESPDGLRLLPNVADNDYGTKRDEFDTVDHLIELHGHIIGMCLSPDHRYLYVNSRPWPQGYEIDDALYPPPIAQEIDIHVIDLTTMHEVGTMHRAHKAYTPNDECFFIFLDVCHEYVASGAEDKHGYLWDRHYGVCLTKFPHADVVNSVAFNPQDPEMLITASDDNSLKIWRSRNRELQVKGHLTKVTEP